MIYSPILAALVLIFTVSPVFSIPLIRDYGSIAVARAYSPSHGRRGYQMNAYIRDVTDLPKKTSIINDYLPSRATRKRNELLRRVTWLHAAAEDEFPVLLHSATPLPHITIDGIPLHGRASEFDYIKRDDEMKCSDAAKLPKDQRPARCFTPHPLIAPGIIF